MKKKNNKKQLEFISRLVANEVKLFISPEAGAVYLFDYEKKQVSLIGYIPPRKMACEGGELPSFRIFEFAVNFNSFASIGWEVIDNRREYTPAIVLDVLKSMVSDLKSDPAAAVVLQNKKLGKAFRELVEDIENATVSEKKE